MDRSVLEYANLGLHQVGNIVDFVQLGEPNNLIIIVRQPFRLMLPEGIVKKDVQIEGLGVRQVVLASASFLNQGGATLANCLKLGEGQLDVLLLVEFNLRVELFFLFFHLFILLNRLGEHACFGRRAFRL